MKIKMFDKVQLKNGKVGFVVEIYEKPVPGYCIDVDADMNVYDVKPDEIEKVVKKAS